MLHLVRSVYQEMVAHCFDCLPEEACGLLAGPPGTDRAVACYPTRNVDASARTYTVDPLEHLKADRDADSKGWQMIGVFHSHTHTDPYPSATDVDKAPDPGWHYAIISLKAGIPALRAYRIEDGMVREEPVTLQDL